MLSQVSLGCSLLSYSRTQHSSIGGGGSILTVCLKENICIFFSSSFHFEQKRYSCNQCYKYAPKSLNFLQQKHEKKKNKEEPVLERDKSRIDALVTEGENAQYVLR